MTERKMLTLLASILENTLASTSSPATPSHAEFKAAVSSVVKERSRIWLNLKNGDSISIDLFS